MLQKPPEKPALLPGIAPGPALLNSPLRKHRRILMGPLPTTGSGNIGICPVPGLSSAFITAHATLDAIPTADRLPASNAHVRWLVERGRVLRSSGKPQDPEMHACFLAAYTEATADFFKADAAHMLAIIDSSGAPPDAAPGETWTVVALRLARASANPHTQLWAASVLHNAAWDAMDAGDPRAALAQFTEARALRQRAFEEYPTAKNRTAYRIARWAVGRALRECGENREAYELQKALWMKEGTGPSIQEELAILKKLLGIVDEP
ncbi:hypothetical protein DFH09DRAFT_1290472 [Mycena vulgaris]|nr:hypothetical protein DFH09DRAFT_1290472 [Mycena vulgaris]